jgi:tight adherence protein B
MIKEKINYVKSASKKKEIDYRYYSLGISEMMLYITIHGIAFMGICILFYNTLIPMMFFAPFELFMLKNVKKRKCRERQRQLYMEFKEMINSLAANLSAGYSLEKAFEGTYEEMKNIYQGNSYIEGELKNILKGMDMKGNVESLLENFGIRSGIPDVIEFAGVVKVAKNSGGNLVRIIKRTADNISRKFEVENEIDTLISAKRMEQRIMTAMPFGIICYLRLANKGYMDVLYGNMAGITVMTICLFCIWLAWMWGRSIIDIEV